MAQLDQVKRVFNDTWDWSTAGDEWSQWWGGTPALWYGALLPRIYSYLPTGTILEIAPGHGRWSQYLKDQCERLVLVDVADKCIEACRARFATSSNIDYFVNDGRSLDMLPDLSVDFAFSWDSLVHVDADVLESYLAGLARLLTEDGVAFLHHSNAGHHPRGQAIAVRTPERLRRQLVRRGLLLDVYAWRDPSVSAAVAADLCARVGLACIGQEVFTWEHGPYLTEAITICTRPGSSLARSPRLVRNPDFGRAGRRMAALYAGAAPQGAAK
jgi:SAM-dependent methyltransferase